MKKKTSKRKATSVNATKTIRNRRPTPLEKRQIAELIRNHPEARKPAKLDDEELSEEYREFVRREYPTPTDLARIAAGMNVSGSEHEKVIAASKLWDAAADVIHLDRLHHWEAALASLLRKFQDTEGRVSFDVGMTFLRPSGKPDSNLGLLRRWYDESEDTPRKIAQHRKNGFSIEELMYLIPRIQRTLEDADREARQSSAGNLKTGRTTSKRMR